MILKQIPEDFVVKEILGKRPDGKGDYFWFSLKKTNWELFKALKAIGDRLGVSRKRFGYAGTKDKRAVTEQTISVWKVPLEKLNSVKTPGLELSDFKKATQPLKLGDLKANWFRISVRDLDTVNEKRLSNKIKEIKKSGLLNLFDQQRFGHRNVTHLVGREIVRGNFKRAVWIYLTKSCPDEKEEVQRARKELEKTRDLKQALKNFPVSVRWEVGLLNHLVNYPNDYVGALNKLPKTLRLMFVHAYQSHLFNQMAVQTRPEKNTKLPLVGFETKLDSYPKIVKEVLEKEGADPEDFKISSMPKLSCKGAERDLLILPTKLKLKIGKDEINKEKHKAVLEFEIPRGSYATLAAKQLFGSPSPC